MSKTFKDLIVGDVFDFVKPNSYHNSFFDKCVKINKDEYVSLSTRQQYVVGTINCPVYNVVKPK